MKATFHLGWVTAASLLAVNTAGEGTLAVSSGSPSRQILLSVPVADRLATQEPRAPDLASALWVVTPLPITVPARYGYYGTARSLNDRGDVLGNDLSQMKHVSSDGVVTDLGIYRFHYNSGRQLDNSGRLALNAAVGTDGLLLQLRDGLPPTETRFTDTRLTSVDNEGGLLGVALNLSRLTDQDYWGQHFLQRGTSRRDLPAPADSGFGADFVTLNERDEVAGSAYQIPREWWRGLYLKPGNEPRWLPGFGAYEEVYNMNTHGQIVGSSSVPAGFGYAPGMYPAFWENGGVGRIAILDTDRSLFGGEYGWAWAINRWGHVVGRTRSGGKLWLNGRPHDLTGKVINLENVRLDYFSDINDKGEIIGAEYAIGGTKGSRAFIMRPIWPSLAVDLNRDGIISLPSDGDKSDLTTPAMPFRFWVNDDDDDGDEKRAAADDIPLPDGDGARDSSDTTVDGIRDLEDFFPVILDIKQLLDALPPGSNGISYCLRQDDSALGAGFTSYTRTQAFDYLRGAPSEITVGFGPELNQAAGEAIVTRITTDGVDISTVSPAFFDRVKGGAAGVLLVEARKATNKPLILQVRRGVEVLVELKLPLKIDPVESMYHYVNLRSFAYGTAIAADNEGPGYGSTTPTPAPNDPFATLNGRKNIVFVHGYNVNGQGARGAAGTAFKRFFWSGSRARFYAVLWRGDDGQGEGIAPASVTPDYHRNVGHAWQQGPRFRDFLSTLEGHTVIMAHSLGNVVTKVALTRMRDASNGTRLILAPKPETVVSYFAVDAALPMEATSISDITSTSKSYMRHAQWTTYDAEERLWASNWHSLFSGTSDARAGLTWQNVFASLEVGTNFYSSGEEVLANPLDDSMPIWEPAVHGGLRSWVAQEKIKGGNGVSSIFFRSNHGGWGYNQEWFVPATSPPTSDTLFVRRRSDEIANMAGVAGQPRSLWPGVPTTDLPDVPFFREFQSTEDGIFYPGYQGWRLHAPIGDADADHEARKLVTVAKCLGEAIPALSFPQGSNPASGFTVPGMGGNANLNTNSFKNGWPASRGEDTDWRHSDCLDVSYIFHYKLYDRIKTDGGL